MGQKVCSEIEPRSIRHLEPEKVVEAVNVGVSGHDEASQNHRITE